MPRLRPDSLIVVKVQYTRVTWAVILLPFEPLAKLFLCHPERSEGSQPSANTRFFAPLRMTMVVN